VRTRSLIVPIATIAIDCAFAGHFASPASLRQDSAGQDPAGKVPYEENCRKCHGVRGVPPKTMKVKYPKIATFDAEFFAKRSDDSLVTVMAKGRGDDMKSFKEKLSHDQMVAIAAYIRSFAPKG
jgi:mono/diheme cytochrome c family protein